MKFELIDYFDVWGNEIDGFGVNNLCKFGIIEFADYPTELQIQNAFKKIEYWNKSVKRTQWRIDGNSDADFIEIEQKKDGRPLCRLVRISDDSEIYHLNSKMQMV